MEGVTQQPPSHTIQPGTIGIITSIHQWPTRKITKPQCLGILCNPLCQGNAEVAGQGILLSDTCLNFYYCCLNFVIARIR